MTAMSVRQFYKAIKESYGPILEPLGFSSVASKRANYARWISNDICHVFTFYRTKGLGMYHAWCFATSPLLQEDFESRFPDSLSAVMSPFELDPIEVVSAYQHPFFCKNNDAFTRSFNRDVRPILGRAVEFLNTISDLSDLERYAVGDGGKALREAIVMRMKSTTT
jgi:hypothetical protein